MNCGCNKIEMEKEKAKIWIPIDSDISDFEMGADVEVVIKGRIEGGSFHLDDSEYRDSKGDLTVAIDSVEISGKNVFESMVD